MPETKRKKPRRVRLYERIAALMEVPQEMCAPIPVLIWRGRHELEIEGCTGVRAYSETEILLAVGRDCLSVTGEGLILSDFCGGVLTVRGQIDAVSYTDDRTGGNGGGVC